MFEPRRRSGSPIALLFAFMAGAAQAFSLAWPFGLPPSAGFFGLTQGQPVWWLQVLAMATLVQLMWRSHTARQAASRAWLFAVTWLAATFAWLFVSMHTYGSLAAPLAVLAVLALAGALALYYAGTCWLFWRLTLVNKGLYAIVFAALWVLAELARGQWLTGFGWGAVGYAQLSGPLASLLPWVGIYGVTFAAAVLASLLAVLFSPSTIRHKTGALVALLVVGLAWPLILPSPKGQDGGSLSVTLLQGNIAQDEKFEPATGVLKALHWYGAQLQTSSSSLVITPETALAVLPQQLPEGYWKALQQRFASGQQAALLGLPLGGLEGYTNSVVGFAPGQTAPWRYDKHHLVPFGEFIPPMFRWFIDMMHIPLGDFSRGALPQPTFDWQGQRLAISICFENLFSEEMATQFADASTAPSILVNLSNLGWFGEHLAMDQHLLIARTRALEFDRPFLLATNTGQTAIVNHLGLVTQALPSHTAAALTSTVQGRSGITPYAAWVSRFGQWPVWWLAITIVLVAVRGRWRLSQR